MSSSIFLSIGSWHNSQIFFFTNQILKQISKWNSHLLSLLFAFLVLPPSLLLLLDVPPPLFSTMDLKCKFDFDFDFDFDFILYCIVLTSSCRHLFYLTFNLCCNMSNHNIMLCWQYTHDAIVVNCFSFFFPFFSRHFYLFITTLLYFLSSNVNNNQSNQSINQQWCWRYGWYTKPWCTRRWRSS